MERCPEETREIERHKYFLSEKQGHDVGWETAEQDWERHHAARWRREQLRLLEPACRDDHSEEGCCSRQSSNPAPETANGHHAEVAGNGRHEAAKPLAAAPIRRGPLRRLLSRLFRQAS